LGVIAGVSGVIEGVSMLMGITAGLGALGLLLIVFGSLAAAVTLNMGIGGVARRWRLERQSELEGMKAKSGSARVSAAISALKETQQAYGEDERLR